MTLQEFKTEYKPLLRGVTYALMHENPKEVIDGEHVFYNGGLFLSCPTNLGTSAKKAYDIIKEDMKDVIGDNNIPLGYLGIRIPDNYNNYQRLIANEGLPFKTINKLIHFKNN